MPLQLVVERDSLSASAWKVKHTTGAYDATTNPGGFGAPNPVRADTWIHYFAYKLTGIPGVLTSLPIPDDYVGTSSEYIILPTSGDGVYRVYAIPFPILAGNDVDSLYFDVPTKTIKKIITEGSTLDAQTLYTLEEVLGALVPAGDVEFYDLYDCVAEAACARLNLHYLASACTDRPGAMMDYFENYAKLRGAEYQFGFGDYDKSAEILNTFLSLSSTCKHCGC